MKELQLKVNSLEQRIDELLEEGDVVDSSEDNENEDEQIQTGGQPSDSMSKSK